MKLWKLVLTILVTAIIATLAGYYFAQYQSGEELMFPNPLGDNTNFEPERPLQKYAIPELTTHTPQISEIVIKEVLFDTDAFTSYLFTFNTLGKKMSGQLNIPKTLDDPTQVPTIVMIRGYVPLGMYTTGVGTKNAAAFYAQNGYMTIAPDFFGYGESDPEPEDSWQARFEKPLVIIDLQESLKASSISVPRDLEELPSDAPLRVTTSTIGMWGHSNGGQIALTTLEALQEPIPTTLWAPVTAPFPYSVLFYSDENGDEGKRSRKTISLLEDVYDVYDFTLTKHLNRLHAPILLHHGTADDAALFAWSLEFAEKIDAENERREELLESETSTESAVINQLQPIDLTFYRYAGADHNLSPGWNTVVQRDLQFFNQHLLLQNE